MQNKPQVSQHYDATAASYQTRYDRAFMHDPSMRYPANYFRLQLLLNAFINKGLKRIIEVGVGEGTPLATLAKTGVDVWGFDISEPMIACSKERMREHGLNPDQIGYGDIQDPVTYAHFLRGGQFDGLMAMGVMPHVTNDDSVLENMAGLVRPGGSVFIEFRNKLFSLFTFNRMTKSFILDDLLRDVAPELKEKVATDLESRLRMDMPPVRTSVDQSNAPGYDQILSKFHNPFEVAELFKRHGFVDIQLRWYHYHPAMPYLAAEDPSLFREEALALEHEASNWRGYFLCSAFVVEAVKSL